MSLSLDPEPLRVATPPYAPQMAKKLAPAALKLLGLLSDGRIHNRYELFRVAGARYSARIGELRDSGHRIIGPTKWRDKRGNLVCETVPLGVDGLEHYQLVMEA
jgi:hypothetical protein